MDLLVNLGFRLNMEKSVLIPTQRVIYLGMVIDSLTMTFSLPEEKVSAIVQKATLLKNKNQVSVREIYKFIGMCSATRLAVKEAPIHYRQLQHQVITLLKENLLLRNQCYSVKVILLPLALQDLDWWIHNLSISISNPIIFPPPDIFIQTDTFDLGWGGYLKPPRTLGMWTRSQLFWYINRKELIAVFLSLKFFLKSQENVHVQRMTYNSTSVSYLNHMGGTKSGIRHLEMVPTKSYPHFSSTCCRSSEHLRRPSLPLSTVEHRVNAMQENILTDLGSLRISSDRSLHLIPKPPTKNILFLDSRSKSLKNRCIHFQLGFQPSLPVSSISSNSQMPFRDKERQMQGNTNSPSMEIKTLVSNYFRDANGSPSSSPNQKGSLATSPIKSNSSPPDRQKKELQTSCLACVRESLRLNKVPERVSKIIFA